VDDRIERMTGDGLRRAFEGCGCEVRWDRLTRELYATDASLYRVEPSAVAFPADSAEAAAAIRAAGEAGLAVTPRGAGTGLAGGALGEGLVLETARRAVSIGPLDRETSTVRVGAGVVLDHLNRFLEPHGLWFGPDVATSSRATLGGMIANDSSGAHAPVYGTTADHVVALEAVLADGAVAWLGAGRDDLPELRQAADAVVSRHAEEIERRLPPGLVKRWPGYGLDRALRAPGDLSRLVAGSEGTLVAVSSAVLRVVPRPRRRDLVVVCFDSVEDALEAAVELLDLEPAAVEHVDRILLDQTRGNPAYRRARGLLGLDEEPCEAALLVELFDDDGGRAAEIARRDPGVRTVVCGDAEERRMVWEVRRAGLSLLTGRPGPRKATTGIEDVCVRPGQLADYVRALRELLEPRGLEASFYGHAGSGLLHVRPALDLDGEHGPEMLATLADEVSDLCRRFRGSFASEHGVGIARTAHLRDHLGAELTAATAELKRCFDPGGRLNPGKIVDTGRYRIDRDLRPDVAGVPLRLPVAETWAYLETGGGFLTNLRQCNGNGACRKSTPVMCPTFVATGEEIMSTRGRASTIRAALEGRFGEPAAALASDELDAALGPCLACKACKSECPTGVDLALLKSDLLWARHRHRGVPLVDRMIAAADTLGRLGSATAPIANRSLRFRPLRRLMERVLGIDAERPLPSYAGDRFDRWFDRRPARSDASRGRVVLWDDTWVRYHEPPIGRAAVRVLEAAGFEVVRPVGRACCGRPAASRGLLDRVQRAAAHNLPLLDRLAPGAPIVFLEPSCFSMFVDEYRQLGVDGADRVASRCTTFERFVVELLDRDPGALPLGAGPSEVAVHAHCHAAALDAADAAVEVARRIPEVRARRLDTGCCGMAGAYGMMREHRELSRKIAAPLLERVASLPPGAELVTAGTSCRHQVEQLAGRLPLHPAELLERALRAGR